MKAAEDTWDNGARQKVAGADVKAESSLDSLLLPNSSCSSGFCFPL